MSRTRRLALIASIVTSACLIGAGSFVVVSAHTASAEDTTTAVAPTAAPVARAQAGTTAVEVPVRDQVVSGALGRDADADAVSFAYAGDSITARPDSWLHVVESDPHVRAVGGYAHSGYRADQVLHEIGPVPDADVLVVELGTNDVNQAVPTATTIADVDAVVRKVDAHRVLVVAGPPSDWTWSKWGADRRSGQRVLSRALRQDAEAHGWSYVDPFTELRQADGAWKTGTSPDGIHGTAAANVVVARAMAAAITAAAH